MEHFLIVDSDPAWDSPLRDDVIDALVDDAPPPAMPVASALPAFYAELVARWPELDQVSDDRLGDWRHCPWTDPILRTPGAILVSIDERATAIVAPELSALAATHGLRVLDVMDGTWIPGADD